VSAADAAERMDHAASTIAALFPTATLRRQGSEDRQHPPQRTFMVAPAVRHPRLLIPRRPAGAASTVLRSYGGRLSTMGRWGYRGLGGLYRLSQGRGLGPTYVVAATDGGHHPGIDDHLSIVLGHTTSVAIQLSPPRANRKPVLQALVDGSREPAAFVKVGTTALTKRLAAAEADALLLVATAPRGPITAPTVLDHGGFADLSVLTLQALPTWRSGRLPNDREAAAAADYIATVGPRTSGTLSETAQWQRTAAAVDGLPSTVVNDRLRRAYDAFAGIAAEIDLETGGSHGDWSPWNMWQTKETLLVWDWERFSTGVPIGTDLVHYRLQQLVVDRMDLHLAARTVVDDAPLLLRDCVHDPQVATVTALAHLLSLSVRYESEGQAAAGSRRGDSQRWLLPVLEAGLIDVRDRPRAT
jgi:hypothetical protein